MHCLLPRVLFVLLLLINFVPWVQGAEGEEISGPVISGPTIGQIVRLDPELDQLLPKQAVIEVLGDGFEWSEGPVWIPAKSLVLFSDIPRNQIMQWKTGQGISIFRKRVGYSGPQRFTGGEPGTNGLVLDPQGRLVACCHGDRCIKRMNDQGEFEELVSRYRGKRFNSPNDLVFHKDGSLYFTDPPYGLPKGFDDPERELDWCGVYRLHQGKLTLLTDELVRPNGIGFSPDYRILYVAQSHSDAAIWKSYPVLKDGTLGAGTLFHDVTDVMGKLPGAPDGLAVDTHGNLWATGPGGVYIINPQGKVLGRIDTGQRTANCTFGDDGSTLYITADMYFCRVRTSTKGLGY
jgi:gluconolactonase